MMQLRGRVATLTRRMGATPCAVCHDWQRTVLIFPKDEAESDDPIRRAACYPHPAMCPSCGRQVITLVRAYCEGNPVARKDEPDGGGL